MTSPPAGASVPLWTRAYTLTVLTTFFYFIPWALFLPVLPVYVLQELHGSSAAAGATGGVFLFTMALFRTQTDRFERRFGRRAVLFAGGVLFACLNLLYLIPGATWSVLLICCLRGVCFAVVNTSLMALAGQIVPLARRGEGLGYVNAAITLATAVGPFTGLSLAKNYGFGWVFAFCGLISLLGSLISLGIDLPETRSAEPAKAVGTSLRELFEVRALPPAYIIMLLMFGISAVLTFVSVYATTLRLNVVSAYFFVILALCAICSRLVSGRLYDRHGANFVIYPGIWTLAAGLLVLGTTHGSAGMFIAAALVGTSYGIVVPNLLALVYKHSPPHRSSVATATYFTFFDLGLGAGSYLVGVCIPWLGYAHIYLFLSPLILSVALLYHVLCGRASGTASSFSAAVYTPQNENIYEAE